MAFEVGLMEPLEVYLCPLGIWSLDPFQHLPQGREAPTESSGCVPRSINSWSYEGLELFMGHFSDPWSRSLGLLEVGKLPEPGGEYHWAAPGAGVEMWSGHGLALLPGGLEGHGTPGPLKCSLAPCPCHILESQAPGKPELERTNGPGREWIVTSVNSLEIVPCAESFACESSPFYR